MTDILLEHGFFWWADQDVPEGQFAPDSSVSGKLTVSSTGQIALDLIGRMPPRDDPLGLKSLLQSTAVSNSIRGVLAESGRFVLLEHLFTNGGQIRFGGPSRDRFFAHRLLVASDQFGPEEPRFSAIRFGLEEYVEWLGPDQITYTESEGTVSAQYAPSPARLWDLKIGQLKLEQALVRPIGSGTRRELRLTQTAHLEFKPSQEFETMQATDLCERFEDLLVLLTDCERGLPFPLLRCARSEKTVRLYYSRSARPEGAFAWYKSWTSMGQIDAVFGDMVETWLSRFEILGPGVHLYLGNRRGMTLYHEHRFANLIWGLEALHRRLFESEPNPHLVAKICRVLGDIQRRKDRDWVRDRLKGALEPNLATRLMQLFEALALGIPTLELRLFCERCAERRNDVSHFGGMREVGGYEAFISDLPKLSNALDLLYHACILREIGLPEEIIQGYFWSSTNSSSVARAFAAANLTLVPSSAPTPSP